MACIRCSRGSCCFENGFCFPQVEQESCEAQGGAFYGPGVTCPPLPCDSADLGTCCLLDGTCGSVLPADCVSNGGDWLGFDSSCAIHPASHLTLHVASRPSALNFRPTLVWPVAEAWKPLVGALMQYATRKRAASPGAFVLTCFGRLAWPLVAHQNQMRLVIPRNVKHRPVRATLTAMAKWPLVICWPPSRCGDHVLTAPKILTVMMP